MASILWKVEPNKLTNPASYRARQVARTTLDYTGVSSAISARNPQWTADLVESVLRQLREEVVMQLANGNAINLENFLKFAITIQARLSTPVSPLPPLSTCLGVQANASKTLRDDVRNGASAEKVSGTEKAPVILSVVDVTTGLQDVIIGGTSLRLNGTDMYFDNTITGAECVIRGTRSGSTVQTNFGKRANSEIILVADYLGQNYSHNNEYEIAVTTRYTQNGNLRTGTYNKRLRAPLLVALSALPTGILSSVENTPLVSVTNGTVSTAQQVRIQAVINAQDQILRISLLDMIEGGVVGNSVIIDGEGTFTVPGYNGSTVTSLTLDVNHYDALYTLVHTVYNNRLIDILDVQA